MDILIDLETQLSVRLQKTREFAAEAYNYFYMLSQVYLPSQSSNLTYIFTEEQKKSTHGKIIDALKNMIVVRQDFESKMNSSSGWIPH